MEIKITRAEGPTKECGKPVTAASFADANIILRGWSRSAPDSGGYDKCDFHLSLVVNSEDINYDGRYDLKHWKVEQPDIKRHILGHLAYYAGKACPSHITQEQYDADLRYVSEADRKEALKWHKVIEAQS